MRYVDKEQGVKNHEDNNEIQQEQKSQLNYLVNCVKQLRQRLDKERLAHKMDNQEVMERNQILISEIKVLKDEIEKKRDEYDQKWGGDRTLNTIKKAKEDRDLLMAQIEQAEQGATTGEPNNAQIEGEGFDPTLAKEISQKKQYLDKLRQQVTQYREQSQQMVPM